MGFEIDINDSIEEALTEESFDVLAFVKGSATPEHNVKVYTDADAAMKTARSIISEQERAKMAAVDEYSITDDLEVSADILSEEELDALHTRLTESALTFKLKGLAPAALKALENSLKAKTDYEEGGENTEYNERLDAELTARTIVSVTTAAGAVSKSKWTVASVTELFDNLYPSEANKLLGGVVQSNYVSAIFDKAVSADFS